jgi:hypothetical protein
VRRRLFSYKAGTPPRWRSDSRLIDSLVEIGSVAVYCDEYLSRWPNSSAQPGYGPSPDTVVDLPSFSPGISRERAVANPGAIRVPSVLTQLGPRYRDAIGAQGQNRKS